MMPTPYKPWTNGSNGIGRGNASTGDRGFPGTSRSKPATKK